MNCSHCGQPLPEDQPRKALVMANTHLSYQQFELLKVLASNPTVTKDRMFFTLWGAMGEAEPDSAGNVIAVQLGKLKKALAPQGWTVETHKRGGGSEYSSSIYKLVRTK